MEEHTVCGFFDRPLAHFPVDSLDLHDVLACQHRCLVLQHVAHRDAYGRKNRADDNGERNDRYAILHSHFTRTKLALVRAQMPLCVLGDAGIEEHAGKCVQHTATNRDEVEAVDVGLDEGCSPDMRGEQPAQRDQSCGALKHRLRHHDSNEGNADTSQAQHNLPPLPVGFVCTMKPSPLMFDIQGVQGALSGVATQHDPDPYGQSHENEYDVEHGKTGHDPVTANPALDGRGKQHVVLPVGEMFARQ
mmetsp:Transcript_23441/g.55862  ORF Transcript_23441/g.55862 Transcript_23441/m.55862 type:complete len:247 (-) Transcript_23441:648-1388(-)